MKKTITILTICLLTITGMQSAKAQQTRKFVEPIALFQLDESSNERQLVLTGYVSFDATFEGFAERMSVKNVQLYVRDASSNIMDAIENQGISEEVHKEIGHVGYKIPHFTLNMIGMASIGDDYSKIYSDKVFTLQVSDVLGDYTIPEFRDLDKDKYSGSNSWENTGDIKGIQVSEIYFNDYDIRIKNEQRKN